MSGRKYTTIDSNELRDLRQDASKLRGLRQDLPERIERAVRQNQQNIDRRLGPIEARQRKYEEAINGMSQEMREVEKRSARRISENAKNQREALKKASEENERNLSKVRQELQRTAQELRTANTDTEKRLTKDLRETESRLIRLNEKTRQAMHEQEQRLNTAIQQERREREKEINTINAHLASMKQTEQIQHDLAKTRINDAQIQLDFIAENYQHEFFLPNKLASLEASLNLARNSLEQGIPPAALAEANVVFQGLSGLRIELEQMETEWRLWREQAIHTAERILAQAHCNRQLNGVESDGEIAEADYWTKGKMSDLIAELERKLDHVSDEVNNPMDIQELRDQVEKHLPEMDSRLDQIIEEAYFEVKRSQIRVNVCDLIARKLEDQGFSITDHTYEGEDMRAGFYIKARNRAGSEIVASVSPDGDQEKITIDSFDAGMLREEELQNRLGGIAREMEKHKLQVGKVTEESRSPKIENQDLDNVRKREPTRMQQQERTPSTNRTMS